MEEDHQPKTIAARHCWTCTHHTLLTHWSCDRRRVC